MRDFLIASAAVAAGVFVGGLVLIVTLGLNS